MSTNAKPSALRSHTVPTTKGAIPLPANGPHVLFINHTSSLGGAEQYLYDLITAFPYPSTTALFEDGDLADDLRATGVDVHVVDAPSSMHSVRREATIMSLIGAAAGVWSMARAVARLARDVDVIFANSQKSMLVASLAGKMTGTPVVWSLHDLMTGEHFSYLNRQIARLRCQSIRRSHDRQFASNPRRLSRPMEDASPRPSFRMGSMHFGLRTRSPKTDDAFDEHSASPQMLLSPVSLAELPSGKDRTY